MDRKGKNESHGMKMLCLGILDNDPYKDMISFTVNAKMCDSLLKICYLLELDLQASCAQLVLQGMKSSRKCHGQNGAKWGYSSVD